MGMDAERGRSDAREDIRSGRLAICRYDRLPFTTGLESCHWKAFDELEIEEGGMMNAPKDYCDGYNGVMDAELKRRFGNRYAKLRSEILPPADALHWLEHEEMIKKQQSERSNAPNP